MAFKIYDTGTDDIVEDTPSFKTRKEAEIWCEENGIDYDYYYIAEKKD